MKKYLLNTTQHNYLASGHIPQTTYKTLFDKHNVIGILRIRHHLTPHLEIESGHIGYNTRPTFQHSELVTSQLALGPEKAKFGAYRSNGHLRH